MGVTELQVAMGHNSGMAEDVTINTFHFSTPDPILSDPTVDEVVTAVRRFYQEPVAPALVPVAGYLSGQLGLAVSGFKFYDATVPAPNPPYAERTGSLDATRASAIDIPSECAITLSYRGEPPAGQPQRRARGRLFIGPLNSATVLDEVGGVRVATAARDAIAAAAARFGQEIRAIGGVITDIDWTVYSRGKGTFPNAKGGGTVDWTPFTSDVVDGFVDNAFDTMRSRGTAATSRAIWTV